MPEYIIEIHPKKPAFDPLANQVRSELIESGTTPAAAMVHTQRLYRIHGELSADEVASYSEKLLVDPVVEDLVIQDGKSKSSKKKSAGIVLDVWPKPGVTDPVGETVEKGFRDLGHTHAVKASSATRYVFPKIKETGPIKELAKRYLANELIHDINIRESN